MKFQNVYCSQCGQGFGPGDSGFSHCQDHSASAWLTQTLPPPFDFVFEWEVFVPIGGGYEEALCRIGVDVIVDACGDLEVEWAVLDTQNQPWPELQEFLESSDDQGVIAEAERLAMEDLARDSEYNRWQHREPNAVRV